MQWQQRYFICVVHPFRSARAHQFYFSEAACFGRFSDIDGLCISCSGHIDAREVRVQFLLVPSFELLDPIVRQGVRIKANGRLMPRT